MSLLAFPLLLALSAPVAVPSAPTDALRLSLEGLSVGDPEGRLITLMPTTRCSDVTGDADLADRWCRVPDQLVLGIQPQSLTATLRDDRIDTLIVRYPARNWPLLQARLLERYGAPTERNVAPSSDPLTGADSTATAMDTLRWQQDGVLLVLQPDAAGNAVLQLLGSVPQP